MIDAAPSPDGTYRTEAEAVLFGYDPRPVDATIRPRTKAWRMAGAARTMGIGVLVAPVVAAVPPHAPWVIGALAGGAILARRRLSERYTVVSVEGTCPKCGAPLQVKSGRLRTPHPLPCETCHLESTLRLPEGALEGMTPA